MKKVIVLMMCLILWGGAGEAGAQEPVEDTRKFAERCLKKVRNRRFRKLQESYPQAMKAIERIKSEAANEKFGYDEVAEKAPGWIEMMETLSQFPGQRVENKGEVIAFKIVDYKPLLAEAKTKANEAHYQEGIALMEKYKDNYRNRKQAFGHFNAALDFSDNHKADIYRRAATIHYEEGLRLYNRSSSFLMRKEAMEPFKKALSWVNPFKDIHELMAKMYYEEGEKLIAETQNSTEWSEINKDLTTAIERFRSASEWVENYNGANEKIAAVKSTAAAKLYDMAMAHEQKHTFSDQEQAAEYYSKIAEWAPNYRDANERAEAARKRMEVDVLFYERPHFLNPSEIGAHIQTKSYIKKPFKKEWELLSVDPIKTPDYAVREVGKGFILVTTGQKGSYEHQELSPLESTEEVAVYTRVKDGEEAEIDKATYNAAKTAIEIAGEDGGIKLHKYTGTITTKIYRAEAMVDVPVEIWDLRNPEDPKLLKTVTSRIEVSDKVTKRFYRGSSKAKPEKLESDKASLKSRNELLSQINTMSMDEATVYRNCLDELAKSLNEHVEYVH